MQNVTMTDFRHWYHYTIFTNQFQ